MCMGAEAAWVPAVLSAVGTGVSMYQNKKVQDEQDDIAAYYNQRARERQRESMQQANQAIGAYENPEEKRGDLADEFMSTLQARQAPDMDTDFAGSAPEALKKNMSRRVVDAIEQGKQETENLANLRSFGDYFGRTSLETQDPKNEINTLTDFTRGEQPGMRFEMQQAPQKYEGMGTVADLFKAGGQAANMYYATGVPGQGTDQRVVDGTNWAPQARPQSWQQTGRIR